MRTLIIGGTRNLGPQLVRELLEEGLTVSVLNRGLTPDDLPAEVERLRADRSDASQLRAALTRRTFDAVVDLTLYNGADAKTVVELFDGSVGRYFFISTGQVYLVRVGLTRPFAEDDYTGPLMPEPEATGPDHADWLYGIGKREAEDVLTDAYETRRFPFTSLRLPMVNSERDHYQRLYNYILRLKDGGALVVPEDARSPLRHVYGGDVVCAVKRVLNSKDGCGRAYNISQEETVSLEDFLRMLASLLGLEHKIVRVPRSVLEAERLLPSCAPFSGRWMSELANERSKHELGIEYTPLRIYLQRLVDYYETNPPQQAPGYESRSRELSLVTQFAGSMAR